VAVGVGLFIEVGIAVINPVFNTPLERFGPVVSDAFVFLGVIGEYVVGMRASACQEELTRRSAKKLADAEDQSKLAFLQANAAAGHAINALQELAKANERAAELEKEAAEARERTAEIERLTASRHMTPDQKARLTAEVRKIGPNNIDLLIEWQTSDHEALLYSRELVATFNRAGVSKLRWAPNMYLGRYFGLNWVSDGPGVDAGVFRKVFGQEGYVVIAQDLAHKRAPGQSGPNLYVFVGAKQLPIDVEAELAEMGITVAPKSDSNPNA
jgi:hypothetical protein